MELTSWGGVANDTKPRSCFAQKHGLKGKSALFYCRNLRRRGGENPYVYLDQRRPPESPSGGPERYCGQVPAG